MRTTQELIAVTMTALTALSNRLGEGSKPIRDIDIAMDNHQDIISDGEELDRLMEEHSIDADELNQEFPPEQYTDGHVVEVIKERLDKPERNIVCLNFQRLRSGASPKLSRTFR